MTDGTGTLQWDRSGSLGSMQHGNGAWEAMEEEAEVGGASSLSVTYETPGALQEAFARELFSGAVFVPLSERLPVRRPVHVTFHLPFSDARLAVEGEVVASLPSHIARAARRALRAGQRVQAGRDRQATSRVRARRAPLPGARARAHRSGGSPLLRRNR